MAVKDKLKYISFYLDFYIIISLSLFRGPCLKPDSPGYLATYNPLRSPLYPIFLKVYQFVFIDNFYPLIVLQSLFGCFVIHYISKKIINVFFNKSFKSKLFILLCCRLILAIPYFKDIGSAVLTEAVCYPLFLLTVWWGFSYLSRQRAKDLWKMLSVLTLLILTRRQFLFLYPALIVMSVWLLIYSKRRSSLLLFVGCVSSFFAAHHFECAYNYYHIKKYATVPFVGMQTVNAPLFVASQESIQNIANKSERIFVSKVKSKLLVNKMSPYNSEVSPYFIDIPAFYRFYGAYNPICFEFVPDVIAEEKHKFDAYSRDKFLVNVTLTLISLNIMEYIKIIFSNFIDGFGGYFGVLLCFIILAASHLKLFLSAISKTPVDKRIWWLAFLSLAMVGNVLLVSLVELTQMRYTFYLWPLWIITLLGFILPSFFDDHKKPVC